MKDEKENNTLQLVPQLDIFCNTVRLFIKNKRSNVLYDISDDIYYQTLFDYMKKTIIFYSMALGNHRSVKNTSVNVVGPLYDTIDRDMFREIDIFVKTNDKEVLKNNSHCGLTYIMLDVKPQKAIETIYGIITAYEKVYQQDKEKRVSFVGSRNSRIMTSCCVWIIYSILMFFSVLILLIVIGHIIQFCVEWFTS